MYSIKNNIRFKNLKHKLKAIISIFRNDNYIVITGKSFIIWNDRIDLHYFYNVDKGMADTKAKLEVFMKETLVIDKSFTKN